ncbi:MAG: DNA gyrase/topoisomerase IV subunit A, partial [Tannerella sp.]|nr:DNA gyrase/topoisomerase IV subunit A [Tannerella sp.]
GIAVGLSSKILPHNFNELIDASIAYLKEEPFTLYPDFQTGGFVDVSRYNDGERGGSVKVRARISKMDNKTLVINEIPFGRTTSSLIDSILKANDKGKIKIRKIDDNTARDVEILVHLAPGVSSDKTIDALYAFSDCEISISPNCCIIENSKPYFLNVSEVLRHSTDQTLLLLRTELEISKSEQEEALFFASLERIFIEERIYKDHEFETARNMDRAVAHVTLRLKPFESRLIREITNDDILRLMEIKMARILKFNADRNDELIARIRKDIDETERHLNHIIEYTVNWYLMLKEKYGEAYPRRTEIRSFDTIEASKVIEANEKLYINRDEGFIGTSLKKDEFVCNCSSIDDVILFYRDGTYRVIRISEKVFVGKHVIYVNVFKRNDSRTIYNVVYRDGKTGHSFIKRFAVTGVTRDREYTVTKGAPGSRILYFSANPNGEAETVKVILKPKLRQKTFVFEKNFSEILIKGRSSIGNILTKAEVHKISFKQKGTSTLGGRMVWFDHDVLRLNYDGRGEELGEFQSDDLILVILQNGEFYTTNFDLSNHYDDNILVIEKFDIHKTWTAVLFDAEQQYPYIKRFSLEAGNKKQSFLGENPKSSLYLLTDEAYPRIEVVFGGNDSFREPLVIDAEQFIGVKSFRAKGKRVTTNEIATVNELEPVRISEATSADGEAAPQTVETADENDEEQPPSRQMNLFDDQL